MGERLRIINKPRLVDRFRVRHLDRQINNAEHYLDILQREVQAPIHCREMRSVLTRELGQVAHALDNLEKKRNTLFQRNPHVVRRRSG